MDERLIIHMLLFGNSTIQGCTIGGAIGQEGEVEEVAAGPP
jgi:hypothetical protein